MIEKVLALSTAHVSDNTRQRLNSFPESLPVRIVNHDYGWLIFTSQSLFENEDELSLTKQECPELIPIIEMALKNECSLINIDRDAETISELKTFDW